MCLFCWGSFLSSVSVGNCEYVFGYIVQRLLKALPALRTERLIECDVRLVRNAIFVRGIDYLLVEFKHGIIRGAKVLWYFFGICVKTDAEIGLLFLNLAKEVGRIHSVKITKNRCRPPGARRDHLTAVRLPGGQEQIQAAR